MSLRCTAKVQAIVGRPDLQTASIPADANDWYANLLWLDRRKCLLITHAGSLVSVFAPDVGAHQLRPPGPLVIPRITEQLAAKGLSAHILGLGDDSQGRADAGAESCCRGSRS